MVWPTAEDNKISDFDIMELPGHQLKSEFASTHLDYAINLDIQRELACSRLTGIAAVVGKSTHTVEIMERMIETGLNIALINLNFGTTEDHLELISNLKTASDKYSRKVHSSYPLAIGIILSGRKVRTGKVSPIYEEKIELRAEDSVRLTTDDTYKERCSTQTIFVDYPGFANQLKKGDEILIDNEEILMRVEVVSYTTVTCRIERAGILGSYKDVFAPRRCTDMPYFSDTDKENIKMAVNLKLDMIIISFVNSDTAITQCRKILGSRGSKLQVIANIQTMEGYNNYDKILKAADGVMITRQHLGYEVGLTKLLMVQKDMIARANLASVPVIVASHILNSMRHYRVPVRSEIIDVNNCVLDGADCIALSAETAVGAFPVESIKVLAAACKEAEICVWTKQMFYDLLDKIEKPCSQPEGAAIGAAMAAQRCLATMIAVLTLTGRSATLIAKFKPRCPIVAITKHLHTAKYLQLHRGIIPVVYEEANDKDWNTYLNKRLDFAVKWAIKRGIVKVGDPIVSVFGYKKGSGNTNTFKVIYASCLEKHK